MWSLNGEKPSGTTTSFIFTIETSLGGSGNMSKIHEKMHQKACCFGIDSLRPFQGPEPPQSALPLPRPQFGVEASQSVAGKMHADSIEDGYLGPVQWAELPETALELHSTPTPVFASVDLEQNFVLVPGEEILLSFQWDEPSFDCI